MSLATLIAAHNEKALAALANVGIVKRATRDLAAGAAIVESFTDDLAVVIADEHSVRLSGSALRASDCTCSATSVCRHIVLAVLALRAAPQAVATARTSAAEDIGALTEAELRKFAGADWDKAVTLARISGGASVTNEGLNLSVMLPDIEQGVMFLAGQGLAGAAFKGARTARRRVVAAAAIVARAQAGVQALDGLAVSQDTGTAVDTETLAATKTAVAALVSAVFQGGSVIAEDAVFDLSITARAQAAPRLTALLRLLVRQAREARAHHIAFSEDRFLTDAALTYALAQALSVRPDDSALTGVVRRTYRPLASEALIPVGAAKWDIAGGSRGLRLHLFAPQEGTWYSLVQARGAGTDPSFTPQSVYSNPLWGLGLMKNMMGCALRLQDAKVATDNQIAPEGGMAAQIGDCGAGLRLLRDAGKLFTCWSDLRAELSRLMHVGLRHTGGGVPVVIRPRQIKDAALDEIAQVYRAQAFDEYGEAVMIELPLDLAEHFEQLSRTGDRLLALCCEAFLTHGALRLSPLSIFVDGTNGTSVVTLGLDPVSAWPDAGSGILTGLAGFLKHKRPGGPVARGGHAGLRVLSSAARDLAAMTLRFGKSEKLAEVERQARALEQSHILVALQKLAAEPGPDAALRLAYLLHLTEQHAALRDPA